MIDICAFFEYTTDVSRGKMVTIYRKNLLASSLFLLGYSFFFLLAVSGSYDYTASGVLASELEPSKPGKHHSHWLSNHEWDYSMLKGNYHSRRKSRSTSENETSGAKETWTEERSRGAGGKWVPRKKRKFERSVVPESIENATGSVHEEKTKVEKNEDTDAIKNTTMTVEPVEEAETIENDNNFGNETKKEASVDAKNVEKDRLKHEEEVSEEGKGKNATENSVFPSEATRFPTELGQEGLHGELESGNSTQEWGTRMRMPSKEFLKEILRRKDHRHRKGGKKGGMRDIEFGNSTDSEEDSDEDEEKEYEQEDEDEEKKEEEKADLKESKESGQAASNVSSSAMGLLKIISDMFLPIKDNNTGIGPYPWRALTSTRYTKEVSKQEGPNLKRTTKETKSKLSLFFSSDPNVERTAGGKENPANPSKIDNSEIVETDQQGKQGTREQSELEGTTTERSDPMEVTTCKRKETTEEAKLEREEPMEENFGGSWVSNDNDESQDTIYQILDTSVLFAMRILDSRYRSILDWY